MKVLTLIKWYSLEIIGMNEVRVGSKAEVQHIAHEADLVDNQPQIE